MPYELAPAGTRTADTPAESSAGAVVPLVTELLGPRSVLDVGCGDGTWLDAYRRAGVADVFGINDRPPDGPPRVPADRLAARDLAAPWDLGRRFDLVQALEVAGRLPPEAAEGFVRALARHGDAVLFSAPIPREGGAEHANARWPDYWAELFAREGFATYDCVRPRLWGDPRVAWPYAQNCLLFAREGRAPAGRLPRPAPVGPILRLVHPEHYESTAARAEGTAPAGTAGPAARSTGRRPERPYDVAVVVPTVGRPTLSRALRSVYAQEFPGTIQVLVGVDTGPAPDWLAALAAEAPPNCAVTVFDPGYSTSVRHGGVHASRDGGALRTILSYAAHSRLVAYLDDDNWWAPDHLAALAAAVAGRAWAYSLRWYVDPDSAEPLCVDRWESVGPDAGCFRDRFGGWADPNCLLIDKLACEPALRLWSVPLPGDPTQLTGDRHVFSDLRLRGPAGGTGRATVYYTLGPGDVMHRRRVDWIAAARGEAGRQPGAAANPAPPPAEGGYTRDWFSRHVPLWSRLLAPLAGRPIRALEVGVFEGRSAAWLLENVLTHPASELVCVDTFQGSTEHSGLDLSGLEARFRANVAPFGAKVTVRAGRSQDVLRRLGGKPFDLIHVDGSHEAADVMADAVLCWPLLKPGGLLIFDDYQWREFPEPERCPAVAIDGFLAAHGGRYREVHRGYQLWVEKIR
jgi:SAM-dependent methyltransferase